MKQSLLFFFVMSCGFAGSVATARGITSNLDSANTVVTIPQTTPAIEELTESNIEQALAQKEAKVPAQDSKMKSDSLGSVAGNVLAQTKESDIPIKLESRKGESSESNPFVKMGLGLLIVSGLAFASWLGVRKYRFNNKGRSSATQMKILSQFHLGPKKSLAVVRIAGESILIGITDHNISMIKSLSLLDEEIPEESPANFDKLYKENNQETEPKVNRQRVSQRAPTDENDEFAISGIQDFVSTRLKNMRSFE